MKSWLDEIGELNRLAPLNLESRDLAFLNIGFSISGIDAALARYYLKDILLSGRKGFYVDIGCGHPIENSNTYLFYAMGWSGICVDADVGATGLFKTARPRDKVINVGISLEKTTQYYAMHKKIRGMSQVKQDRMEFGQEFKLPQPIECVPLADLFQRHLPVSTSIDFMSIDIEGSELSAFESNDWERFRPRYLVMETQGVNFGGISEYPTVAFLRKKKYEPAAFFGGDVLMRDTLP